MDIAGWLAGLGLEHLTEAFALNEIDSESLLLLSDQDLREMNVPLGPRRKILAAIIKLRDEKSAGDKHLSSVERRQLTILFCDLVASTDYAVRMDPEDFSNLTRTFLARCNDAVRTHNGIAANYIGDAFQALFGYPVAEEDDAERAIDLALEILDIVPTIPVVDGPPLRVRIGIASGLVVVGDFLGAPAGVSTVALGSIPNLSQRLQSLADPQTILTDQETHDRTSGAFDFTALGMRSVKGFPTDVKIWRVERARVLENRFAKRTRLSNLVGRCTELAQAIEIWNSVGIDKRGKTIVISGEAGIGKSRLIFEIRRRIPGCTYLTTQCISTFSSSALYPFLALLKRYAGIESGDEGEASLQKLEAVLGASDVPLADSVPIFARLLSIEQTLYAASELAPMKQRGISQRILIDWLHSIARVNPVLLSIEDEQWIDPSSSSLLETLVRESADFPMLILVTTREDQLRNYPCGVVLHGIKLARFSDEEARTLASSVSNASGLTDQLREAVLQRAEGVPLYIEELARAAGEVEIHSGGRTARSSFGVPSSLQSSLLSRLDKIGPGKAIAQIASIVGREFDRELLYELSDIAPSDLELSLERLVHAGLITTRLSAGRQIFSFTHVLLQEAASDTLLRERYRELHQSVAKAITLVHPKLATEHPELIAQHLAEAALYEQAADYWLEAGINAGKTWAKVEAAIMFENGLRCLAQVPSSTQRDRLELRLELERGDVLYARFGYVTEEANAAYRNVLRLSERLDDPDAPIRALDGLFGTAFNTARFSDAEWAGDQLLEIGNLRGSVKALVLGLQFKGMCLFSQGRFDAAKECLEQALGYRAQETEVGSDFPSMAMLYLSWTLQLSGSADRALDVYKAAEEVVQGQSAYRQAACLGDGCILMALRGDIAALRQKVDELTPLAENNGFRMWSNMASFFKGLVMVRDEDDPEGLERMRLTCYNLGEQEIDKSCYLGLLADCYLQTGDVERATATVNEALALVNNTGEHYFTAELLRLHAEIRALAQADDVAECFTKAIDFAHRQGAAMWERKAIERMALLTGSIVCSAEVGGPQHT
ncbi:ATP-binding protein [Rhizobium leguminosarum]